MSKTILKPAAKQTSLSVRGGPVSMPEVRDIRTDHILPDPHQPRKKKKVKALSELEISIKNSGVQQMPTVNFAFTKGGEDYYYIKFGERRWTACKNQGVEVIRCIVSPEVYAGTPNIERKLKQATENSLREGHTHSEIIDLVEEVIRDEVRKRNGNQHGAVDAALIRVARAFGLGPQWARNYHQLAGLISELRELLDADDEGNRLNFSVAKQLAQAPKDMQARILNDSQQIFEKFGHAVGLRRVALQVRQLRIKRGEKMRGHEVSEEHFFGTIPQRLQQFADRISGMLYGERKARDSKLLLQKLVGTMDALEVDDMLSGLNLGLQTFMNIRTELEARRKVRYQKFTAHGEEEEVA